MNNSALGPDYHIFRFSKAIIRSVFNEELFSKVIATEAFRRLSSVHFLGSIDYLLTQSGHGVEKRQTRFDHSLAVANLAKRFSAWRGIKGRNLETIIVAALLHDIGHAPLSHSLEPAFRSIFELDHHVVGEKILRGEVRLGLRLATVLEQHGINNFEVMALISGVGSAPGKDLFSRSINVDTIEGIIRSASYLVPKEVGLNPISVIDAFATLGNGAQDTLDEFWRLKDQVYGSLIQSRKGLVADFLCKRYMELNAAGFNASYYYGTEKELRGDHRALFDALDDFGRSNRIAPALVRDGDEMPFVRRRFHINPNVVLKTYADIDRRYLQSKEKVVFQIKKAGGEDAHSLQAHPDVQDLF